MVGVSADKPETQKKFIDKFSLTFPMVSDRSVIEAYGAKLVLGVAAERKTVLVDPQGLVAHIWSKVKVDGHADDVVKTIERLMVERS